MLEREQRQVAHAAKGQALDTKYALERTDTGSKTSIAVGTRHRVIGEECGSCEWKEDKMACFRAVDAGKLAWPSPSSALTRVIASLAGNDLDWHKILTMLMTQ